MKNVSNMKLSISNSLRLDYDLSQIYFDDNIKEFYGLYFYDCILEVDYKKVTKKMIIDFINDDFEVKISQSKDDLIYLMEDNYSKKDIFLAFYNFMGYSKHITRGYCQGDIHTVFYKDYFKGINKYIDNIFWDSPISGSLILNFSIVDNEGFTKSCTVDDIYIDEYLNDLYDISSLDKEGLFKRVLMEDITISDTQKEIIKSYIEKIDYEDIKG